MPAIMREVNSLYDVDCLYTNAWPPIGSSAGLSLCDLQQAATRQYSGILARLQ